jgi:hypothetical protein
MGYNPVQLGQQPNSGSTSVVLSSDEVSPSGFLKVTDEPTQLFYDPFDSVLDVGTVWSSANGNSGVAAAVTFGFLSIGNGYCSKWIFKTDKRSIIQIAHPRLARIFKRYRTSRWCCSNRQLISFLGKRNCSCHTFNNNSGY